MVAVVAAMTAVGVVGVVAAVAAVATTTCGGSLAVVGMFRLSIESTHTSCQVFCIVERTADGSKSFSQRLELAIGVVHCVFEPRKRSLHVQCHLSS